MRNEIIEDEICLNICTLTTKVDLKRNKETIKTHESPLVARRQCDVTQDFPLGRGHSRKQKWPISDPRGVSIVEHTDLIIEVINRTSDGICTGGGVPKSKDRAFSNGHLGNSDGMGKRQVREVGLTLTFLPHFISFR